MKFLTIPYILISILSIWLLTTLWAQFGGIQREVFIGDPKAEKRALIVYNPDPFYNLDEQVAKSFAYGLYQEDFSSVISTVKKAKDLKQDYDLYVFCANTYNFAPDWLLKRFIRTHPNLERQNVVAITLGAGATRRAKIILEGELEYKNANILASESLWLLRPNEECLPENSNIENAIQIAEEFGQYIGRKFN